MINSDRLRILTGLALTAAALLLLAAGLSSLQLQPGRVLPLGAILQALRHMGGPFTGFGRLPFDPFRLLAAVLWVALIVSVILFIISPDVRREVIKRVIIYLLWSLLIYGIFQVFQPFSLLNQPPGKPPDAGELVDNTPLEEIIPPPPAFVLHPPAWLVLTAAVLLVAVPLIIGWFVWSYWHGQPVPVDDSAAQLARSAQTALDELEIGQNLQDTVLRCYRDMSRALAQQRHLHRARGMTPREFEQYLANSGLRTEHVHRLTRLFERVRYGGQSLGRREEMEALDCFNAIVNTYGRPR